VTAGDVTETDVEASRRNTPGAPGGGPLARPEPVGETHKFPDGAYYDEYRIARTSVSSLLWCDGLRPQPRRPRRALTM
jgi:hypothetical protein